VNHTSADLPTPATSCLQLAGAVAALWVLLAGPAFMTAGAAGLEGLSYAAALCLIPGWLVFLIASRYSDAGTRSAIVALGGTAMRMIFVLLGALILKDLRPHLGFHEFVVWLLAFYLAMLVVETLMAVRMSAGAARRSRMGGV
jgi:hypothetical protein